MTEDGPRYQLPKRIESYLSALSELYAHDGKKNLRKILVNSRITVSEDSGPYWNDSAIGHTLVLTMPQELYVSCVNDKISLENEIKNDINRVCTVRNEYIEGVVLDFYATEDYDWRKESGLLLSGARVVLPEVEKRIWGADGYRLFLSHKASAKKDAAGLKEGLRRFGVSCFVAHQDIIPTREWQTEIESALLSMDALAALLTADFHDSLWTDQETGFAFGRGVPIVCVKLGRDPYGFIGKFQALTCTWQAAPVEIAKLLLTKERMLDSYINCLSKCESYNDANLRAAILPGITKLTDQQVGKLLQAFNACGQMQGGYAFNGKKPNEYGPGLAFHLQRLTGRSYHIAESGQIEPTP